MAYDARQSNLPAPTFLHVAQGTARETLRADRIHHLMVYLGLDGRAEKGVLQTPLRSTTELETSKRSTMMTMLALSFRGRGISFPYLPTRQIEDRRAVQTCSSWSTLQAVV